MWQRRLAQRALDWQVRAAFSGGLCGSKWIPAKWLYLVPPTRR
ncbi:MAG TPA: hypothetical protein VLD65_01085 [Anaerolineales bacterium]|nr:hypothetical protein [Anaerolineales bacterium]